MNNLSKILLEYKIKTDKVISNLEWKTQDSNSESILFYNVSNQENALELCHERLSKADFAIAIVNGEIELENVYSLESSDLKELKKKLLNFLYPLPDKLFYGVTGTNGKTTTVDLIRQLLRLQNKTVLTVGTLGAYLNDSVIRSYGLTTPDIIDLRKLIFEQKENYECFAMELSSHALIQDRIGDIRFDAIGWTNFTQDHLDFHETMEEYFRAKSLSFNYLKESGKYFVCETQKELIKNIKFPFVKCAKPENIKNPFFKVDYNKENLSIAMAMLGVTEEDSDIDNIKAPAGRFNIIEYKDNFIIIDYAHTPDAIESVCREIKMSFENKNVHILFGCGGDRDRTKRPLMAKASQLFADKIYLTSDNPRFEDPEQIIADTAKGFDSSSKVITEVDRTKAINLALAEMNNTVLIIAGKGNENYIDIKGKKIEYSDLAVVKGFLND